MTYHNYLSISRLIVCYPAIIAQQLINIWLFRILDVRHLAGLLRHLNRSTECKRFLKVSCCYTKQVSYIMFFIWHNVLGI